ncbi:MAG: hypothetical protein CK425_02075 [Parachlamydia sp.]|nr:MAG: hypothetical protein CK425_02075 [Parachlamydia sp.]
MKEISGLNSCCFNPTHNFFTPSPSKINLSFFQLTGPQRMQYISRSIVFGINLTEMFEDSPLGRRHWLIYFLGVGLLNKGPILQKGMDLVDLWSQDKESLKDAFQLLSYLVRQAGSRQLLVTHFLKLCALSKPENSQNFLKFRFQILMSFYAEFPPEKELVEESYRTMQELIEHIHPKSILLFKELQHLSQESTDKNTLEDLQKKMEQIIPIIQLEIFCRINHSKNIPQIKQSLKLLLSQTRLNTKSVEKVTACLIKFGMVAKIRDLRACLSSTSLPEACQNAVCRRFLEHLLQHKPSIEQLEKVLLILEMTQISNSAVWGKTLAIFSQFPQQHLKEKMFRLLAQKKDFTFLVSDPTYKLRNLQTVVNLLLEFKGTLTLSELLILQPAALVQAYRPLLPTLSEVAAASRARVPQNPSKCPSSLPEITLKALEIFTGDKNFIADDRLLEALYQIFEENREYYKQIWSQKYYALLIPLYIHLCTHSQCTSQYINCLKLLVELAEQKNKLGKGKLIPKNKKHDLGELSAHLLTVIGDSSALLPGIDRYSLTAQLVETGECWSLTKQPVDYMLLVKALVLLHDLDAENTNGFPMFFSQRDCGIFLYLAISQFQGSPHHEYDHLFGRVIDILLKTGAAEDIKQAGKCLLHKNAPKFLTKPKPPEALSSHPTLLRQCLTRSFDYLLAQAQVHSEIDISVKKFVITLDQYKNHLGDLKLHNSNVIHEKSVELFWLKMLTCFSLYFFLIDEMEDKKGELYLQATHILDRLKQFIVNASCLNLAQKQYLTIQCEGDAMARLALHRTSALKIKLYTQNVLHLKKFTENLLKDRPACRPSEFDYLQRTFLDFFTKISPLDSDLVKEKLTLGQLHKQNCLEFLQRSDFWPEKNSTFMTCLAYVNGSFDKPPTAEILNQLIETFPKPKDTKVSPYLLYLFSLQPESLTLELVISLIQKIQSKAHPIIFLGGAYLLMQCRSLEMQQVNASTFKTLHTFAKDFLKRFDGFEPGDVKANQYLSLWKTIMDIYLDWGIYEKNYPSFFKLVSEATHICYSHHHKTNTPTYSFIFFLMTPSSVARLESRISEDLKVDYAQEKDSMLEKWLQLLNDGIKKEEHAFIFGMFNYFVEKEPSLVKTKKFLDEITEGFSRAEWINTLECQAHEAELDRIQEETNKIFTQKFLTELKNYSQVSFDGSEKEGN